MSLKNQPQAAATPPALAHESGGAAPSRPRRLSRGVTFYIGREILKVFLLVLFILEVIHGSLFTIEAVREFGFDLLLLLPVFWRSFAYALYHAIPISLLFGTSLVFGRMIADREILAMRSFGISPLQLLVAPAVLGLVFTVSAYFLNGYVIPELRFFKRNVGRIFIEQLEYLGEGWNKRIPIDRQTVVDVGRYRNDKLSDITIFAENPDSVGLAGLLKSSVESSSPRHGAIEALSFPFFVHAEEGEVVSTADSGRPDAVSELELELRNVRFFIDFDYIDRGGQSDLFQHVHLSRLGIPIVLDDKARGHKDMPNPMFRRELATRRERWLQLAANPDVPPPAVARAERNYREAHADFHKRHSFAGICLMFPITAALLALALNSTNRLLPFFVAVTVNSALFFPLEMQGRELAELIGHAWILAQSGNIALLLLSVSLFLRLERRFPFYRRRASAAAPEATP